jgi:hypothetical protein
MLENKQTWQNGLMLALSICLIQWHSIQFWIASTGAIGPLWSIAIEAAALWLWWQQRLLLACCASLILVVGPLTYLAMPVYESAQLDNQNQLQLSDRKVLLQGSIAQLSSALESYQQTSESRVGWAARIDETQSALQAERQRFENLIIETQTQGRNALPYLTISIETLSITILMFTQILAIHALRGVSTSKQQIETVSTDLPEEPVTAGDAVSTLSKRFEIPDDEIETTVTELSKRLTEALKVETISQAEWARRNCVSKKSVSMLFNHSKRKSDGKECISKNELSHISKQLNSNSNSEEGTRHD